MEIIAKIYCELRNPKITEYYNIEDLKTDIRFFNDYLGPLSFKVLDINEKYKKEINEFIGRIIG